MRIADWNKGWGTAREQARRSVAWLTFLLLAACQVNPEASIVDRAALDDIQETLAASTAASVEESGQPPQNVLEALVPGLQLNTETLEPVQERFDFVVIEPMDAREFFSLLTEGTDYSIVVHPSVSGTISNLDLKNVTIDEALDQISALYGFVINQSGNIYQVLPGGLQTRIFRVNYLNVSRNGNSNMSVVGGGIMNGGQNGNNGGFGNGGFGNGGFNNGGGFGNGGFGNNNGFGNNGMNGMGGMGGMGMGNQGGAMINTQSEADYWNDLEDIIASIINAPIRQDNNASSGGLLDNLVQSAASSPTDRSVIVSPQTGMIVVRAYPDELDQVAQFLAQSQDVLQRQVILEAKILEVTLNEGFQTGIDLSLLGRVNSTNTVTANLEFLGESLSGLSSPLELSYGASDFDGVLRLLETQGNVQVISSPRISTLNNQKAVFKVGGEQYFATNAASTTTVGGNNTTTNDNLNLQPFFSGIALDVTPQISESGDIILHIHPLLNQVQEEIRNITDERQISLANSTTRESDSIARARNGEVVVISGLMQTRSRGNDAGIPGAKDLPVVGYALGQRQSEVVKTELVILLRAIIDEGTNMQDVLREHTDGFDNIRRQIDPYYR